VVKSARILTCVSAAIFPPDIIRHPRSTEPAPLVAFLIYTGWARVEAACPGVPHIIKPATHRVLLAAVEDLIRGTQISN
jgi:hypothetical protein